ncbi:MAG: filamentous hemagglutinin N-terminal domain-containing protein, partial [Planctomycetes bacterium]|nr:filamentous hemagglutinin N-terminal domain-containing protein [Planctomycetota bacterium]
MQPLSEKLSSRILAVFLCLSLAFPSPVFSNDKAGTPTVIHGGANFHRDGDNLTVVTGSDRTIITWDRFGVPGGSTTHYAQPGVNAATLNRVQGSLPSHIDGVLSSNGAVYVTNAHGVVVGANGVVRTDGGFVASTLDVADADFLGGGPNGTAAMRFTHPGAGDGTVANHGVIESAHGDVFLLGTRVTNSGRISAENGVAGLAAGREVLIHPLGVSGGRVEVVATEASFAGGIGVDNSGLVRAAAAELRAHGDPYRLAVNNTGIVEAKGVARTPEGRVFLTARGRNGAAGSVVNAGRVKALAHGGSGGDVYMTAGRVTLAAGSSVDASATRGDGGNVYIGGAFQGGRHDDGTAALVPNATDLTVAEGARVSVDGAGSGDGGVAVLWSDGRTDFAGQATARGGLNGGDGGFVEVSGKEHLAFTGSVDTSGGTGGRTGTLLLDPQSIVVNDGSHSGESNTSYISASDLATALSTSNVVLMTDSTPAGDGNIRVERDIYWNTDNSLALLAFNNIHLQADVRNFTSGGNETARGSLTMVAGWDGTTGISGSAYPGVPGEFIMPSLPGSAAAMASGYDWFGDTAGRTVTTVNGVDYKSNIILDAANQAVNIGSRNGATTLLGNDVTLMGGTAVNAFAQVGYYARNNPAASTEQIASGSIAVFAKNDVTLNGGGNYSTYTQIGHGGGVSGIVDYLGYNLNASNASLTVRAGDSAILGGGTTGLHGNAYASIGHGGGMKAFTGNFANAKVTAIGSPLQLDVVGDLKIRAGTRDNSFASIGHGVGISTDDFYARSTIVASQSDLVIVAGNVEVSASSTAFASIGHGGGVSSTFDNSSYTLTANASSLAMEVSGNIRLTAGNGLNTYASIGHGGGAAGSGATVTWGGGTDTSMPVDAKNITLSGSNTSHNQAFLGMGIYSRTGSTFAFTMPDDANGDLTIRTRDGGVSFGGNISNIHIVHSGTGDFSLITSENMTLSNTAYDFRGMTLADGDGRFWLRHSGAINLVSEGDITVKQTLVHGNSIAEATGSNIGWKDSSLTLVAGWNPDEAIGWTDADPAASGTASFKLRPDDLPTSAAATRDATWFGNGGSIAIAPDTAGVAIASRHGATTLLGNDVTLTGGTVTDAYAHVGFKAANDPTASTPQIASGSIAVYARNDVTLTGGGGDNTYTQIGHGGGGSGISTNLGYYLNASNASLTVRAGDSTTLRGGTNGALGNMYTRIGHGGGLYSAWHSTANVTVTAKESPLHLDVVGDVKVIAGSDGNSFASIGHGVGVISVDTPTSSIIDASESNIVVTAGNIEVSAAAMNNTYASIGHGGGVLNIAETSSSNLTVTASSLVVEVDGNISITAADATNSYAGIGHGGGTLGIDGTTATWNGGKDINMSVDAKNITLSGGNASYSQAFLGMGTFTYIGGTFAFTMPDDATGDLTIRTRDGGVTFGDTIANTHIIHSGTGDFSLITSDDITLSNTAYDFRGMTLADGDGRFWLRHSGAINLVSEGDITVKQTLVHGNSIAEATGSNIGWKDSSLTLVAGWNPDEAIGWTDADPAASGTASFKLRPDDLPTSAAATRDATWFGNGGSIAIAPDTAGVAIASRHGATTLLGNDVTLTGGTVTDAYAQVGYNVVHDTTMTAQIASGSIDVYAKNDVKLSGGGSKNSYAHVGHGGGWYSNLRRNYNLDASNSSLMIRTGNSLILGGGGTNSYNAYARIGHGGGQFSRTAPVTAIVTANGSPLQLDVDGDLKMNAGSGKNSFVSVGHGVGFLSMDDTAQFTVNASNSIITIVTSGLEVNAEVGGLNSYAGIGHGVGALSDNLFVASNLTATASSLRFCLNYPTVQFSEASAL